MTSSPKYKLIYFDIRARAEPIRWMFAYAGVPFDDYRFQEPSERVSGKPNTEWNTLKPQTPFGTIPVLQVAGEEGCLGETTAIARYLTKPLGINGANEWEWSQADSIVTFIDTEFKLELVGQYYCATCKGASKEERRPLLEEVRANLEKVATTLEKLLRKNPSGFFVGESPTIADFFAARVYDVVDEVITDEDILWPYSVLRALRDKVRALPGVKEFIDKTEHPSPPTNT